MKTYFTIIFLTLSIACSGQSKKASIKENHSNNVMNVDSILTQIDSVLRVNNALQDYDRYLVRVIFKTDSE